MQYLRARYYNPSTGTFNRLDPFAGNTQDPQSLHKYLYTHGDPIQGIDPRGLMIEGWPDPIKGTRAHLVFSEYCIEMRPGAITKPGAILSTVLSEHFSVGDDGWDLKPDAIDRNAHKYFELKPVTHKTSMTLQNQDYTRQLSEYDRVLPPIGYGRGTSSTLVPYLRGGKIIGRFEDLDGLYYVLAWPETRGIMTESGHPGRGLIYYSLEKRDKERDPIPKVVWVDQQQNQNRDVKIEVPGRNMQAVVQQYWHISAAIGAGTALISAGALMRSAYLNAGISFRLSIGRFGL
jgi:hypothetical protein